jgi:hypothetical protein
VSLPAAAADFRAAVDAAPTVDAPTFARRTRNAIAQAVLAAAFSPAEEEVGSPEHRPPAAEVSALVGDELARDLLALYDGGEGWTSRAIDVLEPLHTLTRR